MDHAKIKITTKHGQQWCHVFDGKSCAAGTNFSLDTPKEEIKKWALNKINEVRNKTKTDDNLGRLPSIF